MKFLHTQDQLDLRDGCREFLRDHYSPNQLREWADNPQQLASATQHNWQALADMGLVGAMLPESLGGLGLDTSSAVLLAEEMGYVAMPEPLIDMAAISLPLLAEYSLSTGNNDELIDWSGMVSGEQRVLCQHQYNPYINDLQPNDYVLVIRPQKTILVDAKHLENGRDIETLHSIDPLRRLSRVIYDNNSDTRAFNQPKWFQQAGDKGALFNVAQLLGLTQAMIDMATDYAQQRQQFDHAIGRFQAVKHHLSTAYVKLEFVRPVLYRAAAAFDQGADNAHLAISHAKLAAIDSAINAAECAIQIHGAMGYTFEVPLHLWIKRVWALVGLWGDRDYHTQQIEHALAESLDYDLLDL